MGAKTKIDWCDATWNPVTGCLHGCKYCYARRIAERFGGCWRLDLPPDTSWRKFVVDRELMGDYARHSNGKCHVLDEPEIECAVFNPPSGYRGKVKPYPYSFDPTFHRYRLDEPQHWEKPRTIFVCSMADLFGEWVPDEWIEQVFEACEAAPQHRYLFLTKNPQRYNDLMSDGKLPEGENYWYGGTRTGIDGMREHEAAMTENTFLSVEPLLAPIERETLNALELWGWIIVGAETGIRKGKITPKREWVNEIAEKCKASETPLFMKESLRGLMGADFRQEFPWEVSENGK